MPGKALRLENRHTGEELEIRRAMRDGVEVFELRGSLPPHREGPPRHIHHHEDEEGYVTGGMVAVELGGQRLDVGPGQRLKLPRGVPHRWWNQSDSTLTFEGWVTPAVDLDRYLEAVFEVMNAGSPNRPPLFYLAHVALRHRKTQTVLAMPGPLQAIVFRVAVLLGTLLGRYRGTDWPGCPVRCVGVPPGAGTLASTAT